MNAAGMRLKRALRMGKVKLNNSFLFALKIEQPAYASSGCIGAGRMPMGGTYIKIQGSILITNPKHENLTAEHPT